MNAHVGASGANSSVLNNFNTKPIAIHLSKNIGAPATKMVMPAKMSSFTRVETQKPVVIRNLKPATMKHDQLSQFKVKKVQSDARNRITVPIMSLDESLDKIEITHLSSGTVDGDYF